MKQYRMIDSKDISSFVRDFLAFIGKSLSFTLSAVKAHFVSALIILLVIAGTGFYKWKSTAPYFESEMACTFNYLHQKTYGEMIQKLNVLAGTQSYPELAKVLQISESDAAKIISLEPKNVSGSPLYEDITTKHMPVYINVKAREQQVFYKLQPALMAYMNNIPYRNVREHAEISRIERKIAFIKKDLAMLDSSLAVLPASYNKKFLTDSAGSVTDLYIFKDKLEDRLLYEEKLLAQTQSIELLHGFMPPSKPVKAGSNLLMLTTVVAVAVAVLWAILLKAIKNGQH